MQSRLPENGRLQLRQTLVADQPWEFQDRDLYFSSLKGVLLDVYNT